MLIQCTSARLVTMRHVGYLSHGMLSNPTSHQLQQIQASSFAVSALNVQSSNKLGIEAI